MRFDAIFVTAEVAITICIVLVFIMVLCITILVKLDKLGKGNK